MRRVRARRPPPIALCAGLAIVVVLSLVHPDQAGLACLGPAVLALALLWLGRYPGEQLLLARIAPLRRRRRSRPSRPRTRPFARVARGGLLLGVALAGRAPPRPAQSPSPQSRVASSNAG